MHFDQIFALRKYGQIRLNLTAKFPKAVAALTFYVICIYLNNKLLKKIICVVGSRKMNSFAYASITIFLDYESSIKKKNQHHIKSIRKSTLFL